MQQVHQEHAEEDGDGRDDDRVRQRLQAHPAQAADVPQARHAQRQRRKEQRQHEHEQQPQEDLPDRLGDIAEEPRERVRRAQNDVG